MKKLLILLVVIVIVSCSSPEKRELFKITDAVVESLQTTYNSYGLLGGLEHIQLTKDGYYQVMPTGRLINVKIMEYVDDDKYESLRKDIERHYRNDSRVNSVYRCQGGTIMIDCRN